jgi:hypothetical protein
MEAATHLLRRGFEATMGDKDGQQNNMPAWGAAILAVTFLLFFASLFSVRLLESPKLSLD